MKQAVIDLGTNTFHLIIREKTDAENRLLFRESRPARIGKSGINQGLITEEAIERALGVLTYFREVLDRHQVEPASVTAIGTSAIRNAGNQQDFVARVRKATGISIQVIDGEQEADYIFRGVRAAGALDERTALVMDIGGGSVELILGNQERVFWKQSLEIGGQRLMERFMDTDPISAGAVRRLHAYFREQLMPLANAIHQYEPQVLVGSSGSFDTLTDLHYMHQFGHLPEPSQNAFDLPLEEFQRSYGLLISRDRTGRLQLPGMVELRVDLIVVAVCLIDYVLRTFSIRHIRSSTYSLKEGVLGSL